MSPSDPRHPIITVIMPVFNGHAHLREAVESILGQTFSSFEFLVVNDGSTDDTAEILASYAAKDGRVRVVYQANAGIVAALNAGLALARGVYIARMDADDIAYPERLEIQVGHMKANPNCVACGSDYELIGARKGRVRTPRTNAQCQARLLVESCFAHPTVMLRSAALRSHSVEYESEFQYAEDYRLWTRLAKIGELGNIDQPLLSYRLHPGQISSSKQRSQQQRHAKAAISHLKGLGLEISEANFSWMMWNYASGSPPTQTKLITAKKILSVAYQISPREAGSIFTHMIKRMLKPHIAVAANMFSGAP